MNDFTHYSLFDGYATIADFAPLPAGGLRQILVDLHRQCAVEPDHCVRVGDDANGHFGALHPEAEQVSLKVGQRFTLILMSRQAVVGHAAELESEGNADSARLARQALST